MPGRGRSARSWKSKHCLVRYTSDGVVEVKYQADIEFEDGLPPDNRESIDDFRAGDIVMARWKDGLFYEAVVLNTDESAENLQKLIPALRGRGRSAKRSESDPALARRRRQAEALIDEVQEIQCSAGDQISEVQQQTEGEEMMSDEEQSSQVQSPTALRGRVRRSRLDESEETSQTQYPAEDPITHAQKRARVDISDEEPSQASTAESQVEGEDDLTDDDDEDAERWKEKYRRMKTKYTKLLERYRELKKSPASASGTPKPGTLDPELAKKHKMTEVSPGSGVFWYAANKQCAQATAKTGTQLASTMVDIFFSREVLKQSNLKGGGNKSYRRLDPAIISAIQSYVTSTYKDVKLSAINQVINNKCTAARRGCREATGGSTA